MKTVLVFVMHAYTKILLTLFSKLALRGLQKSKDF